MSVKQGPPLGATNGGQRLCTRLLGYADDRSEVLCNAQASHHVIYWWDDNPAEGDAGFDHGYCCAKHMAEYLANWRCAFSHEVNAACGMPGSRIVKDEPCRFEGLTTAEPVRAVAVGLEASR